MNLNGQHSIEMIALIGALYGIEKQADVLRFSDAQRGELRREKSCAVIGQINDAVCMQAYK